MVVFSPLDRRFDGFLYASILERDGLSLSVLSALTRQHLDPWEEAARLAGLPRDQAVDSLAATIWRCSDNIISGATAIEAAIRLVGLLPTTQVADSPYGGSEDLISPWLVYGIFLFMMAISANADPPSKIDQAPQPSAITSQQTAKAPPDTMVRMQP